ncbi:hypothetical protein K2F43_01845 [Clostridium estertheticum]|uniref:hypothetical protein n=1 Tax=Clostridium estertheticum TaxID=238834 RepID=UPI001C6E1E2D|nr:hypothetical protein [Clostridium estertheticum]MBW9169944.1 hypothetical protein [Clostridium estertheticum]WLC74567.1 hypothetical protein KTC99_17635 [Clostridium estertheticum]
MAKCVRSIHTNEIPAKEKIEALDKAKELALKLNELHGLYFLVTNVSDKMEVNLIWMMLKVYLIITRMN